MLRLYAEQFCRLADHLKSAALQITVMECGKKEREIAEGIVQTLIDSLPAMRAEAERLELEVTADHIGLALKRWSEYHDYNLLMHQCSQLGITVQSELSRRLCFILPRSSHDSYVHPRKGWEDILFAFPDATEDVEEMNRCLAFGRSSAAVFHVLLAVEHGVVSLGRFLGVKDKKPGWDATCNALAQILARGRRNAPLRIRKKFQVLEIIDKDLQSMKLAWRNKVSHAANHLFVMTSDFKPEVAEKIITSSQGFLRLLATELRGNRGGIEKR